MNAVSSRSQRDALIVFAKVPEPGAVKTRLAPPLTEAEAAHLYDAFLRDALAAYGHLDVALRLYLAPSGPPTPTDLVPEDVSVHTQRGEELGARMLHAFVESFQAGYERVVVIGTDHPTLPLPFVQAAFAELGEPFTVTLGPSADGGYYLLGLNELYPQLFQGITYSRPDVFARTLERATAADARVVVLPEWYDVDTLDALRRLAAELAADEGVGAPRTREVVSALRAKYPLLP